jgi:predicted nucleic acid-binding protein
MQSVYLDSTILSYLHEKRPIWGFQSTETRKWWRQERMRFHLYISTEVLVELSRGKYPTQSNVLRTARKLEILPRQAALVPVISTYISRFVMPRDHEGDAAHLAYTSFYGIDFLLTWNCQHLANANKYDHIRKVNDSLGLATPKIVTPLELFKEE